MVNELTMIFEVGFNYCCRNFVNKSDSCDNFSLKLSCNLLNQVTNLTENCVLEFCGEWARTLSFLEPGMDMQIVSSGLMREENWSKCVSVRNLTFPDPGDVRHTITKISVVETQTDRPNRLIVFDSKCRVSECMVPKEPGALLFPNYWMFPKRSIVDKDPRSIRPLTTITPDIAVVNVLVAFIANSPPGPYKFERGDVCYVRTHVHVCDLSYQNLRLSAIRTANDFDFRDVPAFHLHVQIDKNVEVAALPFLTVGDVLEVSTVKPVFAQKQAWNLFHKEKKFGETKIRIHRIVDGIVVDVEGNVLKSGPLDPRVKELRNWMRKRLENDSLVGPNQAGKLNNRHMWMNGRDIAVKCIRWNKHTSSIFVTDNTIEDPIEVRIRSTQPNFAPTLNYLFSHLKPGIHLLLRNARFNPADDTLICSLEHVTKLPPFCYDVKSLSKDIENSLPNSDATQLSQNIQSGTVPYNPLTQLSQNIQSGTVPYNQTQSKPLMSQTHVSHVSQNDGCVDGSSQLFEYADSDDEEQAKRIKTL